MSRGPVPKRSEQRIRRNKDSEVETIQPVAQVEAPPLDIVNAHPMIIDLWDSLQESAQAQYYEASDWQFARVQLHFLSRLLWDGKPSAVMLQTINSALTNLLLTEGDRRRVRLEVERSQAEAEVVDIAAELAKRQAK